MTIKTGVSLIHLGLFALTERRNIWKWVHSFHSNQLPQLHLEAKRTLKIYIFRLLFQSKNGVVRPKKIKFM